MVDKAMEVFVVFLAMIGVAIASSAATSYLAYEQWREAVDKAVAERDTLQAKLDFANKHCNAVDEGWELSLDGWAKTSDALHRAEELIDSISELIERYDAECAEGEEEGVTP